MAQPLLARSTPAACAACYGQYPDRAHIDYRAAIEGRLVDPSKPRGRHVDWVVICEDCLRAGLAMLPEATAAREAARATDVALRAELAEARTYAATLEAALAARPQREHVHPVVTPAAPVVDMTPPPVDGAVAAKPPTAAQVKKQAAKRGQRYAPKGQA